MRSTKGGKGAGRQADEDTLEVGDGRQASKSLKGVLGADLFQVKGVSANFKKGGGADALIAADLLPDSSSLPVANATDNMQCCAIM